MISLLKCKSNVGNHVWAYLAKALQLVSVFSSALHLCENAPKKAPV